MNKKMYPMYLKGLTAVFSMAVASTLIGCQQANPQNQNTNNPNTNQNLEKTENSQEKTQESTSSTQENAQTDTQANANEASQS